MVLTKSDFLHYRSCRKDMWLNRHKPEAVLRPKLTDFDLMLMQDGYEVEAAVKNFVTSWPDFETLMFQKTYQSDDGLLVRADLIRQIDDTTIDLFEIKSSTSIKGHIEDAAFQVIAIERSGITVRKINIIHVDKAYIRSGKIDPEGLLITVDVTAEVRETIETLEGNIDTALAWIKLDSIDEDGCECRYEGSIPNQCSSFDYFNPGTPEQSIYLLPNIRTARVREFVDDGRLGLKDINADEVTASMLPVLQTAHAGTPIINKDNILKFLKALRFPLYFYDYETFKSAVPIMDGTSPHEQVPVQVSIHKLTAEGRLTHGEFLASGIDERRALLGCLSAEIGNVGNCVSWNKSFEIGCNRKMALAFPEHEEFLASVNDRTVDLMGVFKRDYVDIRFRGSTSIKNVLPVVCPHLSYDELAVGNGGTAMAAWLSMSRESDPNIITKKRDELLVYCQLDTFAMVEIYRFLLEVTRE